MSTPTRRPRCATAPQALVGADIRELASVAQHLPPIVGRTLAPAPERVHREPMNGPSARLIHQERPVLLRRGHEPVDEFIRAEPAFDHAQVGRVRPGLDPAGGQQRAAVLVG